MEESFRFSHRLKVRYSEIDSQNIVFNAHYLTYLDVAMTEYMEEGLQLDYQKLAENEEFDFVLAKSTLEYKNSAHSGDWLDIWVCTKAIGNSSFTMSFKITRDDDLILLGEIIYVSYHSRTKSSVPIPDFVRQRIEEYENKKY